MALVLSPFFPVLPQLSWLTLFGHGPCLFSMVVTITSPAFLPPISFCALEESPQAPPTAPVLIYPAGPPSAQEVTQTALWTQSHLISLPS